MCQHKKAIALGRQSLMFSIECKCIWINQVRKANAFDVSSMQRTLYEFHVNVFQQANDMCSLWSIRYSYKPQRLTLCNETSYNPNGYLLDVEYETHLHCKKIKDIHLSPSTILNGFAIGHWWILTQK